MTRQGLKNQMMGTTATSRLRLQLVAAEYLERMGQRMRLRREQLDMTRGDVARAMPGRTNENAIYRWERGLHRPEDDALEALATVLQVSGPGWFFADELKDPDKTPSPFAGQDDLAGLADLIRQDMAQREQQRAEIIQRLDRLEGTLAEAISEHVSDAAERLEASVAEAQSILRAASQDPPRAASKRAPKRTRTA